MKHGSHQHRKVDGKNILITILLNVLITTAQMIGGVISGSMALISDAAHNFSDVLSLIFTYSAARLSVREQTLKQTFGFKRAGIFAAFINAATLLVIAGVLIFQAVTRLIHPEPVAGSIVIYLAAAGILLNGLSLVFIRRGAQVDMNIKSAYLHLFTDMLTSVAVFIGGFAIKYLGWIRIDSILTILIALFLIYNSWGIFYEAIRIFMQFTPSRINIEEIADTVTSIEGVKNIHHVHVWQLDDKEMMLEAHLDLDEDFTISRFEDILDEVGEILKVHGIHHFNIQPELFRKDTKELINIQKSK